MIALLTELILQPGTEVDMSTVYGSEHLLRMLGKNLKSSYWLTLIFIVAMPNMVASSTMDPESVAILREYIHELMGFVSWLLLLELDTQFCRLSRYMVREKERIFQITYDETDTAYQNVSRS